MTTSKKQSIPPGKSEFEKAVKQNLEVIKGVTVTKVLPVNEIQSTPTTADYNTLALRFNQLLERLQN